MGSALIVIDVQRGLFDPEPRPWEADAVVGRIHDLADRARSAGVPVVWVQHETPGGALAFGSEGWLLERGLEVHAGDLKVRKTTPDAFLRTDLEAILSRHEVGRLVVCGYATEFCVDTTTRRAAALGYDVALVADAHTTHGKDHATAEQIRSHHNATLPDLTSFGSRILTVHAVAVEFEHHARS